MKSKHASILDLIPNPDWAKLPLFDRKGWKRVRFGDVVENINETCDPEEAGLKRYIGLEHLEPGALNIRKWGEVSDGTTFTRQCRPGQVLFGKRRAYQRKVAVAEFEAVVSGDIYVLAPKNDKLLSQLLPFICLSERFFQHAVGTSAGSLSPRTNWISLATFEFDLPPLDQQRRIAEILWAVDETVTNFEKICEQVKQVSALWFINNVKFLCRKHANRVIQLGDVVEIRTGKLDSNRAIEGGKYQFFTCDTKTLRINTYSFDCEALLLAGNNAVGVYPLKHYKGKFDAYQRTYVITTKKADEISYLYLLNVLKYKLAELQRLSVGSATKFLTMRMLLPLQISLPSFCEQTQIVAQMKAFDEFFRSVEINSNKLCDIRCELLKTL